MSKKMNRMLGRLSKTSIKLARPSQQDQTGSVGIFNTYFVSLNCTIEKNFALCTILKKLCGCYAFSAMSIVSKL